MDKEVQYVYTMEYYSDIKGNAFVSSNEMDDLITYYEE